MFYIIHLENFKSAAHTVMWLKVIFVVVNIKYSISAHFYT